MMYCEGLKSGLFVEILTEIFSENLKFWLESEGRRSNWVASKVGVSKTTLTHWTRGDHLPRQDQLVALADLIGVHWALLLTKDGLKNPREALREIATTSGLN